MECFPLSTMKSCETIFFLVLRHIPQIITIERQLSARGEIEMTTLSPTQSLDDETDRESVNNRSRELVPGSGNVTFLVLALSLEDKGIT